MPGETILKSDKETKVSSRVTLSRSVSARTEAIADATERCDVLVVVVVVVVDDDDDDDVAVLATGAIAYSNDAPCNAGRSTKHNRL